MCLAIPGKIKEILDDSFVLADFMGITKKVAVDLVEDAKVGDYLLVHAGFAINKIDQKEALVTIEYLKEIYAISE